MIPKHTFNWKKVSIPYWCDWKFKNPCNHFFAVLFQFLIGAIGRLLADAKTNRDILVSIPYWCDWKAYCFPTVVNVDY